MAHLKDCLRDLEILDDDPDIIEGDIQPWSIGSLDRFKKLKRLCCSTYIFQGPFVLPNENDGPEMHSVDEVENQRLLICLPRSLEMLELRDCGKDTLDQVKELVERKGEVVPKLESVRLKFRGSFRELGSLPDRPVWCDGEVVARLKMDCRACGVRLHVRSGTSCW
jgi:hypothetical protein